MAVAALGSLSSCRRLKRTNHLRRHFCTSHTGEWRMKNEEGEWRGTRMMDEMESTSYFFIGGDGEKEG